MLNRKKLLIGLLAAVLLLTLVLGMFVAALMFAEELQIFKMELYKKLPWRDEYAREQETNTDFSAYPVIERSEDAWYNRAELIMHACGGIDGLDYTNSREAMELSLEKGCRFIEVDFTFSADGVPVCVHSWSDLHSDEVMDYDSFMAHKVFGKYSPMDAQDVLDYMEAYPELYIILDTKDSIVDLVRSLVELGAADELMQRFIVQLYGPGEKAQILELYPFPEENFLFTAYILGNRPGYIMQLCYDENISVVTLPYGWYSEKWHYFDEKNFVIYTHTVNRPDEMKQLLEKGVKGLYTDFLSHSDLAF